MRGARTPAATVKTDAAGRFTVTALEAGGYVTLVRYRAAAPADAGVPYRSYSHTLTFEAIDRGLLGRAGRP